MSSASTLVEVPRIVYRHTVEAFVEQVLVRRGLLTPDFIAELKQLGLDVTQPREQPPEVWVAVLRATAARLSPARSVADGLEDVGRAMASGFLESLAGRALFVLLRMLGPHKAFLRMPENIQSADTFTQVKARSLAPGSVELIFNTTLGAPTHTRGILLEALFRLNTKNSSVSFTEHADSTAFVVTWAEPS